MASTHYRRIIEALTKVDRILKPMWPQQLQQVIFDIRGLPPPLQLTSGNDLGGVERSLEAYCAAYNVHVPKWTVEWNANPQPAFRLLPNGSKPYLTLQLLAVFKALRYNSFFKAISFRDVDLSPLTNKKDYSQYGDTIVTTSLTGYKIPNEHYDYLLDATVLTQEIHALMFSSESIKVIDFTNSLGSRIQGSHHRSSTDYAALEQMSSELIRPMMMLMRWGLFHGHSVSMAGNHLGPADVDELTNILMLEHTSVKKLDLSNCSLGEFGLSKIWSVLPVQANCLESLDLSDNAGTINYDYMLDSLNGLRAIKQLKLRGNTRLPHDIALFEEASISNWVLEELDLSGIVLNDPTVDVLADYFASPNSHQLQLVSFNNCGLTGSQIARLFRGMGQGRRLTVHINASRLDEGIDDLCGALACNYAPWSLFAQMIDFCAESSYIKLLRALTVNKTIECLSLAGSSTPDAASDLACQAVADFFSKNNNIRFLDISGYDSKLDEGRLGRGFSTALQGLRENKSIEHLRVRSQMLNINIGDLAEAISANTTLHTLDCESNDFNLSNYHHLVKHLEQNYNIRHFSAFSPGELDRTIRKSLETTVIAVMPSKRTSMLGKLRHEKASPPTNGNAILVDQLKSEWAASTKKLEDILERNQRAFDETERGFLERSSSLRSTEPQGEKSFSTAFGGLALRQYELQRAKSLQARKNSSEIEGADAIKLPIVNGDGVMGVVRTSSTASSHMGSTVSDESIGTGSAPTPPDLDTSTKRHLDLSFSPQSPDTLFEDSSVFSPLDEDGLQESDLLLMAKSHRRYQSDPFSRIEEESDGNEADRETP